MFSTAARRPRTRLPRQRPGWPAHQSIPLPRGTALVGGFVGVSPEKSSKSMRTRRIRVGADLQMDGVWMSGAADLAHFEATAIRLLLRRVDQPFHFRVGDAAARVEVLTFCSRTQPTLALQQVTVEVDQPGSLVLQANLDPRAARELGLRGACRAKPGRASCCWESRGGLSSVGAAYATEFVGENFKKRRRNDYGHEQDMQLTEYHVDAKPGQRYVMRQFASLVPSADAWRAALAGGYGTSDTRSGWGSTSFRADNRAAWAELWKSRPRLVGAEPKWQDIADAAFFYLHSSVAPCSPCSVAPFGLSRRTAYSGHVFWDSDGFVMPVAALTSPGRARAIMDYRSRCLPAARANAQLNGSRGGAVPVAERQRRVGGHAVLRAGRHGRAITSTWTSRSRWRNMFTRPRTICSSSSTHGPRFRASPNGSPAASTKTRRGFEIRNVTGPDETFDNVHNNAFTNVAAILVLREAIAFAKRLGFNPPAAWQKIERRSFCRSIRRPRSCSSTRGMSTLAGCACRTPLVPFFPLGYRTDPAVEKATHRFYLDRADTFVGMPMFSCFFCVWAARQGNRKLSRQLLEQGMGDNLIPPYHQFIEATARHGYSDATATVFLTNATGFLMACYLGLPGIQISAAGGLVPVSGRASRGLGRD